MTPLPIHYATRITMSVKGTTYTALCGYVGFNAAMFINGINPHAAATNARGEWRVTCLKCQKEINVCDTGGLA